MSFWPSRFFLLKIAFVVLLHSINLNFVNFRALSSFCLQPSPIFWRCVCKTVHTCQPDTDRSQMTEIFPIDDAHALTGNGRRACTTQSLTDVSRLDITLVSPILPHSVKKKRHLVRMLLPIHEQVWKNPLAGNEEAHHWGQLVNVIIIESSYNKSTSTVMCEIPITFKWFQTTVRVCHSRISSPALIDIFLEQINTNSLEGFIGILLQSEGGNNL